MSCESSPGNRSVNISHNISRVIIGPWLEYIKSSKKVTRVIATLLWNRSHSVLSCIAIPPRNFYWDHMAFLPAHSFSYCVASVGGKTHIYDRVRPRQNIASRSYVTLDFLIGGSSDPSLNIGVYTCKVERLFSSIHFYTYMQSGMPSQKDHIPMHFAPSKHENSSSLHGRTLKKRETKSHRHQVRGSQSNVQWSQHL